MDIRNWQLALIVLRADPMGMEESFIELAANYQQIGFHSKLPCWDAVEESHDEYVSRVDKIDHGDIYDAGLHVKTLELLDFLGFEVRVNDCEGCENEGCIYEKQSTVDAAYDAAVNAATKRYDAACVVYKAAEAAYDAAFKAAREARDASLTSDK